MSNKPDALVGGRAENTLSTVREHDCVELYLPKRLAYLSALYDYLQKRLRERPGDRARGFALDGFSIYEVDGAWLDQLPEVAASSEPAEEPPIADERTLVIRVLVPHNEGLDAASFRTGLNELAEDIATLAPGEKAILISYHRQHTFNYYPHRDK
jgi:hypothetical protein